MKFVVVAILLMISCVAFEATYEQVQGGGVRRNNAVLVAGGISGIACTVGTVPYTSLTTAGGSQEINIVTGQLGTFRYDQVLVSPSTAFTGGGATGATVSMGRPGSNNSELTGALVSIGSGSGYWSARPIPPQLTSTYNVVLNFAVATGNVNTFTAGSLDYEVCGYISH